MILVLLCCTYTCLILTVLLYYLFLLVCACVKILFNKLDYGKRHTEIPGGSVTGMEKGLGKETMRFGLSVIFGIFSVDASRCTDKTWQFCCTCTVVFPPKD